MIHFVAIKNFRLILYYAKYLIKSTFCHSFKVFKLYTIWLKYYPYTYDIFADSFYTVLVIKNQ